MLSIPIDHSQNHDRFSHEELLSSQGSDESLGVLAHVDEGANTTIELREFDNQTLLEDVKQTKKPSSCFKKFIITGIAISAIDLTASSINPLPFVNNNTFGKLKTNNQGLALLSSMTQSNLVGEIIYGPWESVHSTKQQILVIGSQSLAALVFDLIASQKLGMSSSISLTISWNLICRMLSYKLYNKLTYQPLEEKTVVPVNKKTRFAMNAVVIATNDIAAACLVNTMGQNQQMISIATLFYGTISSRFTTMLYSEVNQSEYKHRKIWIPIIRISSLFAAHGIVSTLLSETTIDTFTNPLVTVGAGSSLLLASRIFLEQVYKPESNSATVQFRSKEHGENKSQLAINAAALLTLTTATAVANRFTSSSETKLISNIAYAITNMQLTRGLFDNVKSGCEQAAVLGLGLISSYAIEQLANETIPGNPAPENWERYMGPVTYLALATTCTFFATLFVNKVWRQNK